MSGDAAQGGRGRQGVPPGRPAPLPVTLLRRTVLTPHLVRMTLTGEALDRFRWPGPAGHLKLLLPAPGAAIALPAPGSDGLRPTLRTYTARHFDPAARELDVDVVLHGDGPASRWAKAAELGEEVGVTVPRRAGFAHDPAAEALLLAGDASALPAIASILESGAVPADRTVFVEIDDPDDRLELAGVTWLVRAPADPVGAALERALADVPLDPEREQVWVAAEAGVVRRVRAALLRRLAPGRVVTRGYWRLGASNHPDHDFGDTDVEQLRSRSGPPPHMRPSPPASASES